MYKENYINSLRDEIVGFIAQKLSPISMRYGYDAIALESVVKWKPTVLILGNYSSGKSTLINDIIGAEIQATGQAPTDDSFTVLTYGDPMSTGSSEEARVEEERDGRALLNDQEYPFEKLKEHGKRFAAHFSLKYVSSPLLKDLAIIDTPGMLDSSAWGGRGYDYQKVVSDLAEIADLILVLFDPHKAGTVAETHKSLKETLPEKVTEDKIVFVLNRIDECSSLTDLLRVYGTLCWNLSQATGRKDIPPIHLVYSQGIHKNSANDSAEKPYLAQLSNAQASLKQAVIQVPKKRLDNLVSYIESQSLRMTLLLRALQSYLKSRRALMRKISMGCFILALLVFSVKVFNLGTFFESLEVEFPYINVVEGAIMATAAFALTMWGSLKLALHAQYNRYMWKSRALVPDMTQVELDEWPLVEERLLKTLKSANLMRSIKLTKIKKDLNWLKTSAIEFAKQSRKSIREMNEDVYVRMDQEPKE